MTQFNEFETITETVILDEPGESLEVLAGGDVVVEGDEPAVLTQSVLNVIENANGGFISAEQTAIRIEGTNSVVDNDGIIFGEINGIDVANGGVASASILNREDGIIASDSRPVNLGGDENTLVNQGEIFSTNNPRNGTVYGDITANTINITNTEIGTIDVGNGNDGGAISLELGPIVRGSLVNSGEVLGRGLPGVENPNNQAAAVRLYSGPDQPVDLPPSTFIGDIVNEAGGVLSAENGPAVVIEEDVTLNGSLINRGNIESPNTDNGVGIRFEAGSDLTGEIVNESSGTINGGRDGIDIGNGGDGSFVIRNEGLITSTSRAVNLGADENTLINDGTVVTSDSPRNGTVYGDILANEIDIFNRPSGLIDVGTGNDGDAISLELGPEVSGSIINGGLVQGRGLPGVVNPNNQASAIRLYSGPDQGTDLPSTFTGNIVNESGGQLLAENGPAVIVEENVTLDGSILNSGTIDSPNVDNGTGVLFEAGSDLTGRLVNEADGVINGGRNGINVGNGGDGSFEILNQGLITSDSRAVNLGADENTLINEGEIISTANPRNGTVYGDILANQIDIHNRVEGVIDVGAGNDGDAISLELGPDVSGSIVNAGEIFGRGLPGVESPANFASAIRLYSGPDQGGDQPSTFTGDIVNEAGGSISAEHGPAVVIEEDVTLNGQIINRGAIAGGATTSGDPLAINGSGADGVLNVLNEGTIIGDVLLSDGDDRYEGTQPASHDGVVEGGGGEDILLGTGDDDHFSGGDDNDLLSGRNGDDELNGGEGDDRLFGGGNNDLLNGNAGNDSLFGGNGNDTLDGGEGNDRLMGDAGSDTFVFAPGSGSDLVTDFELGLDLLDLTGFGFADFAAVQAVSSQQGNSTFINLDMTSGDNVTLAQIDLTDLTQDSFLL